MFAGGGTLGHILPVAPVARALREANPGIKIYFVGTMKGLERDYAEREGLFTRAYYFDSRGFRRGFSPANIVALYKHFKNYFKSRRLLRKIAPDIVVGMGGYVSGAVVAAAVARKIKTAIHEQNSVYGFTNRVLRKKVDKVLLSYDIEKNEKTFLVGNPRLSEIYRRYRDQIRQVDEKTLLVVGGSRGAGGINDLIIGLKDELREKGIKVTLITGNKYYRKNIKKIENLGDDFFSVRPFVDNLPAIMISAGAVVSRAGATTLAEITALKKVSLLIPSPYVAGNHQEKNAATLAERGAALMLKETEMNRENMLAMITELLENKTLRKSIINNLNFIADIDACDKFVNQLNEMIDK